MIKYIYPEYATSEKSNQVIVYIKVHADNQGDSAKIFKTKQLNKEWTE